jgi:IS605 OrfB family transposase
LEHNDKLSFSKSPYENVITKFSLQNYYGISVVNQAKGVLSSQVELNKQYIQDTKNKIKTAEAAIKTNEERLIKKLSILDNIIKGLTPKFYKGACESTDGTKYFVKQGRKKIVYENVYLFEHQYLKPKIKNYKRAIKNIHLYIERLERELVELQGPLKGVCFGSRNFFKKQFTLPEYKKDHTKWKSEFRHRRYNSMTLSGRFDAASRNFVFRYDPMTYNLTIKMYDGEDIVIPQVFFPYGSEYLIQSLKAKKKERKPIAWTAEDHGDYFIFKATVHVPSSKHMNFSVADGLLSYDLNYDHVAWTDVSKDGNLIEHGVIPFKLYGLSRGHVTKLLENVAVQLVDLAKVKNKPLGGEDLDTTNSKSKLRYGGTKRNRKISQFAYAGLDKAIQSRAHKTGICIYKVNPAYTSQIGKMKYMKIKGLSIHISASFVIGRRCLKFKDKVPKSLKRFIPDKTRLKHYWNHWSYLHQKLKSVKRTAFYSITPKELNCIKRLPQLVNKYS